MLVDLWLVALLVAWGVVLGLAWRQRRHDRALREHVKARHREHETGQ